MSFEGAFNALLFMHRRPAKLYKADDEYDIFLSPSNYSRNLEVVQEIVSRGREFVVSKSVLETVGVTKIERGDQLYDTELGSMSVTESRELFDMGGRIIGFRIRTD